MSTNQTSRTISAVLVGHLVGNMWMPDAQASKPVALDFHRTRQRFSERGSLRDCIEHLMQHEGGDFQSSVLSADSVVIVTLRRVDARGNSRTISRELPILALPSVADYADADAYAFDGFDD